MSIFPSSSLTDEQVTDAENQIVLSASSSLASKLTWPLFMPFRAASVASGYAYWAAAEAVYFTDLSLHNLGNLSRHIVRNVYSDREAAKIPDIKNLPFHLLIKFIQSNLEYPGHTLTKMRRSAELVFELVIPKQARFHPFRFHVNRSVLLEAERQAARTPSVASQGYIIPEECSGTDQYELTGEWVEWAQEEGKGKELAVDGGKAQNKASNEKGERVILFLHGGAFLVGSPRTHRSITWRIARDTGAKVFVLHYRLAPEHPFPAAIHDAFAAYLYLTNPSHPAFIKPGAFFSPNTPPHQPISPKSIIVMGDSAGGGLSAGLMVYMKDFLVDKAGEMMFEPLRGAVLMSPWVELTCSTESWDSNYATDYLPLRPNTVFHSMFNDSPSDPVNPVYSYLFGQGQAGRKRKFIRCRDEDGCDVCSEDVEDVGSQEEIVSELKPVEMARRDSGVDVEARNKRLAEARAAASVRCPSSCKRQLDDEEIVFRYARHPVLSPVYADLTEMPPILIQSGDAEMLRDEAVLFAHRLALANPELHERGLIRHELYRDMPHVFQAFVFREMSTCAFKNTAAFINSLFDPCPRYLSSEGNHGVDLNAVAVDTFLHPPPYSATDPSPVKMTAMEGVGAVKAGAKVMGAVVGAELGVDLGEDGEGGWLLREGMLHPFV